jgi:capsular polysaccharide biosynthesis protein
LISLKDLVRPLWKRRGVIVLIIVLIEGLAVGSSFLQTPQYEGSIKILIGQESGAKVAPISVYDLQQLTVTMAQAVDTYPVADAAIRRSNLSMTPETLLDQLDSDAISETQFIEVTYPDSDPRRAQRMVNAVGDAFSERVSRISPSVNAVTATVWEEARVPESPVSPNPVRRAFFALVIGVILGAGLALLLEVFDDRWQAPEEVEQFSGIPTLGVVPTNNRTKAGSRGGPY